MTGGEAGRRSVTRAPAPALPLCAPALPSKCDMGGRKNYTSPWPSGDPATPTGRPLSK